MSIEEPTKLCGRILSFGDKEQIKEFKKNNAHAPFCPKCATLSNQYCDQGFSYYECSFCDCLWWKEKGKIIIGE